MRPPRALMLFAAGFGTRMGPLTADRPKPLIPVAGRPLIDHALDIAEAAGVAPIVVNLHYRGEQLADHLFGRDLRLSWEREEILETGGGLKQALPLLGDGPVLTLNTDAVWTGANPLSELISRWSDDMDGLLLLLPVEQATGHAPKPDFTLADDGRIQHPPVAGRPGYVYLGAQILRTEQLSEISERSFSIWLLWRGMLDGGKLFGMIHDGGWCDVGHPDGIVDAEALLAASGHV